MVFSPNICLYYHLETSLSKENGLFLVILTTIHTLFIISQTIIMNLCYDESINKQGVIRHDGL